jgi:hypothetical protein
MTKQERCSFNTKSLYIDANRKYKDFVTGLDAHRAMNEAVDLVGNEIKTQRSERRDSREKSGTPLANPTKSQKQRLKLKLFNLIGIAQKALVDLDLVEATKE